MKLYTRDEILELDALLKGILQSLLKLMKEHTETFMPGFTHLQKAQPITLAHHLGAYFEMFKRDRSRMKDIYKRMNYCPLGSGRWQVRLIRWTGNIRPSFWILTDRL